MGTVTYHLSWLNLVLAGGLILIAIAISLWQGPGLTRSFVVGAIRTVVQLLVVGYILVYIFELERWYLVIIALLVMLAAAATTAVGRVRRGRRRELIEIASLALLIGSGLTLIYVMVLVTLPGLMTGQILAGESPLTAVRYQIAIMFMLAAASAITAVVVALRYREKFFNAAEQLELPVAR